MRAPDPKQALLERVRAALALWGRPGSAACRPRCSARPPGGIGQDALAAAFRARFEAAGGTLLSGPSLEPLLPGLAELLSAEEVTALLAAEGDAAAQAAAQGLSPFGPFAIVSAGEIRRLAPPRSAGIQSAEFAIAETGTIVQTSRGGKTLLPGLLSDVHVALVGPAAIVPAMEDCLAVLAADPPRNISFVTGPSKTADIEQTLTVGAHGPRRIVAVLISSP